MKSWWSWGSAADWWPASRLASNLIRLQRLSCWWRCRSTLYRGVSVAYPDWIEASGHYGATFFEHIAFNLQLAGQAVDAATPEQALWSLIVASAAQHSMQTGREVDVGVFCEAEGIGDFYEGR